VKENISKVEAFGMIVNKLRMENERTPEMLKNLETSSVFMS
jgi:hypothetical protein